MLCRKDPLDNLGSSVIVYPTDRQKGYIIIMDREYKTSEAQRRASAKYKKANVKNYNFQVNRTAEKELMDHLESQPNKSEYIKNLIRLDMGADQEQGQG